MLIDVLSVADQLVPAGAPVFVGVPNARANRMTRHSSEDMFYAAQPTSMCCNVLYCTVMCMCVIMCDQPFI